MLVRLCECRALHDDVTSSEQYCSVNWAVITAAHSALLVDHAGVGVEEGRGPQS